MILEQLYLGCLAQASYLIGDEETKTAVVIDPRRDVDEYLAVAEKHGLAIRHVFLTHFHADFLAGHIELRDRAGARIHLGARAEAEYDFQPMANGDALAFGKLRFEVLETPGHSPESICILLYDLARDASKPHAVFTGDTLFVGDVGRPDLRASLGWSYQQLGGMLYESLHDRLMPLPDETIIYPGHGAGSACGKKLARERVSTMGEQRRFNYALKPMTKEAFIEMVAADQPDAPAYFTYDAVLNTKERDTLDEALEENLRPLSAEEVVRRGAEGAQILDTREPEEFAAAHFAGGVNIPLSGEYATWAGTLLSREQPIVIVSDPEREREAAMRLGRIGFDHVAGYLKGGMQALDGHPQLVHSTPRMDAQTLAQALRSAEQPVLLDVRTEQEWKDKHIDGSLNVPLQRFPDQLGEIPRDRPLVIHCASGYRSSMAASLLQKHGVTSLADLVGGLAAWEAAEFTLVRS